MAKFDIGSAASRPTGLESQLKSDMIRREIEPTMGASRKEEPAPKPPEVTQQYTAQPEPVKSEPGQELPLPLQTVKWESRMDSAGNPVVYKLPSGDMGGNLEISGINDRYHPEAFKAISQLPASQRSEAAAEYIRGYTAPLVSQLPRQMQAFAQDMAFNRGLGGATRYFQQGLNSLGVNVNVDGSLGPKTLQAISQVQPQALMRAASEAQLRDEYAKADQDPRRKKFISGLESRIRNRLSAFGQG